MSGGPAPQGAGGLKYMDEKEITVSVRSRPARGGWIEILVVAICCALIWSRPARGGWIEIGTPPSLIAARTGPAPQGAGGLKYIKSNTILT